MPLLAALNSCDNSMRPETITALHSMKTVKAVQPQTIVLKGKTRGAWKKALVFIPLLLLLISGLILYRVFGLIAGLHDNIFLVAYTAGTTLYLVSRLAIAVFYRDHHRGKPHPYFDSEYPSVSFVIACKNEEDSIRKTIDACLSSDYPQKMDCVVVNDGSTENTLAEIIKAKAEWGNKLHVISFPRNKGKREGMAAGVLASSGKSSYLWILIAL